MSQAKAEKNQPGMLGENWESIIEKLKIKQKTLQPGDNDIMGIESVIQSIEADALGGNFGHARYFLIDQQAKREVISDIRRLVIRYIPEIKNTKSG